MPIKTRIDMLATGIKTPVGIKSAGPDLGVEFIALAGVAVETAVVMLVFLDQAYERRERQALSEGRRIARQELIDAVVEGALLRVRPKVMTVAAIIGGLLPIMLGGGTGSELMRRIAAPMVGGMANAAVLTPAVYLLWSGARS